MAWYKEWFGQDYLDLYAHRDEEEAETHVEFVLGRLGATAPGRVLDLACGAGRHQLALAHRGFQVVGVDLSITLLATSPISRGRVAGDMRRLPFRDASFAWVLNFFTSFGYFETERENFRVLEEIVRLLQPGGRFMIDFLNSERVLAELKSKEMQSIAGREVAIERWYDKNTRRINKRMRLAGPAGRSTTYLESVRAYSSDEVTIGARWAGLEVDALHGDFTGESYQRDSPRLIVVGHKPALRS
jgi:SAM-dependent methyltransferase